MKILVIYGGEGLSQEADISTNSGEAVYAQLIQQGSTVEKFNLTKENLQKLPTLIEQYDLVLPILHGAFGEDGTIQKIFEQHNARYLGSDSKASALCFNKVECKQILEANRILTPAWFIVNTLEDLKDKPLPLILKPVMGGGSIGLLAVNELTDSLGATIQETLNAQGPLLAEEKIEGSEITVGILGTQALPVVEIIIPKDKLFDYSSKYSGQIEENCPPKYLTPKLQAKAQEIALKAHQVCKCRHLSRVDMMVLRDNIYVLEINTLPGMTQHSLYPKALAAAGLTIKDVINQAI